MKKFILVLVLSIILPVPALSGEKHVAAIDPDVVQRVEVTGGSYFFRPDHIVVKVNTPVELIVKKEPSIIPHNMVMGEPGAGAGGAGMDFSVRLSTGPETVRFTPTETGTFEFYCDNRFLFFRSHRARGMEGVIEVVE